jgi:hypothetical protein
LALPLIELSLDQADTGGGSQAFANSELGGETPNAVAMVSARLADVLDTVEPELITSTGLATSSSSRAAIGQNRDGGDTVTDPGRRNNTSALLNWVNTSGSADRGILDMVSFAADTVNTTWDTTPTSAGYIGTALMKFDNVDLTTIIPTSSGVTISPGFDIDGAIITSANGADSSNNANASWGFVTNTDSLRQCCYFNGSEDGEAAGHPNAYMSDSRCGGQVTATALHYHVTASFPATNQITLTTSIAAPGDEFHVMCFNVGSGKVWCGTVDSPTSTGEHTFTEPGITPLYSWIIATGMPENDELRVDDSRAGSWAHCMATPNDNFSISAADEQGSGTTDTQTYVSTNAIEKPADDGSTDHVATFLRMSRFGPSFDFTSTNASVLRWPLLVIGVNPTPVNMRTMRASKFGLSQLNPAAHARNIREAWAKLDESVR